MEPSVVALAGLFALAAIAPSLTRLLGRNAGYPLAVGYAAAGLLIGLDAAHVLDGGRSVASLPWAPSLGIRLTFVVDGLSLFFSLLVCGVGAAVMAYSARYFGRNGDGRLYGLLTLFAASMLGLVLAGDGILLFVFWELTSVTSYFLIGGAGTGNAPRSALRAFLVTALGGLALFAGVILTGIAAGTSELEQILADPSMVRDSAFGGVVLALLVVAAFTKSAQLPFQFWLPGAMVAPTPVSTYLHAATMVKAGIYLLLRFSPLFAGSDGWSRTVTLVGLATAVVGAALALKQYDLKAILAYSTVSQLGFIIALVGVGTPHAVAAAILHTIAHAAYKATLFMVAGIVDKETGTRDIRDLSGLRRAMPVMAVVTGLAALSMAGVPPLVGFVSKEEAFTAFLEAPGPQGYGFLLAGLAVAASVMTFAYSARIFDGVFGGPSTRSLDEPSRAFVGPAAATAGAGLILGLVVPGLDAFVSTAAGASIDETVSFHSLLWHGLTPAVGLSAVTLLLGFLLFLARAKVDRFTQRTRLPVTGDGAFDGLYSGTVAAGRELGGVFVTPVPARHLGWVFATAVAATGAAWAVYHVPPDTPPPPSLGWDWVAAALLAAAIFAVARARNRMAGVAVLGLTGFLVAALYVLLGAPDLALTQLLVETLTVTLVVLVFRRLPATFDEVRRWRRLLALGGAAVAGSVAGLGTYALTGRRPLSETGRWFLEEGPIETGGANVVNTILVEFRALDTLGEITVLAVGAVGVFALVRIGSDRRAP